MKVLMVNSVCGVGSTGTICTDIAHALSQRGHECYIAYGQGKTTYTQSYKIGTKLGTNFHNLGSRLLGNQGYYSKEATKKFINYIKDLNPDVIHLHNLHGNYINLNLLFDFLSNFAGTVLWTLHDCWAFTGKCAHYTDVQCFKWQTQCEQCPQLSTYPPSIYFDRSKMMFLDKKKRMNSLDNITIHTVSGWLLNEAKKSFLKEKRIEMVYNWVDTKTFKPHYDIDYIKSLNIPTDKFTVLLVSASWDPGTVKFEDMLILAKSLGSDMQIVLVGSCDDKKRIPDNCRCIDYLGSKDQLAQLYSFSNVYVHLSTEDSFGKVIAEAMSCGTPAVVYDSTACAEIVGQNCGYVVEKRNIPMVLEAVNKIKAHSKEKYSNHCRSYVLENFEMGNNINKIIELY